MAGMKAKDADIIMVPGLGGAGPSHWQSRWGAKLSTARTPEQSDWNAPQREPWSRTIADAVNSAERPVVLVAHALGVATILNALGDMKTRPAGAFLVAPVDLDDPDIGTAAVLGFGPYPRSALPFPSLTIGSRNDSYCKPEVTQELAAAWGSLFIDAGEAGHIDGDDGYGPWPEGSMAFAQFLSRLKEPE